MKNNPFLRVLVIIFNIRDCKSYNPRFILLNSMSNCNKMKYTKSPILLVLSFLFMISCDVSSLSDKELNDISVIHAIVHIQDKTQGNDLDDVTVYISDGKKQIINHHIKIIVNDIPLKLYVRNELYYTKKSYYKLDSFPRSDSYYFQIILPDSTIYPLAYIKPKVLNDSIKFDIPAVIGVNKDFTLKWRNIIVPAKLEIWIEVQNKVTKVCSGGRYAKSTIHKNLNSISGEYLIPKSFFQDSLSIANYMKLKINHREYGLINPELLNRSEIIYDIAIDAEIDITKQN